MSAGESMRYLNVPRPIQVETTPAGNPYALMRHGQRARVAEILDVWRVDDEWWREPISRRYYTVRLEDGAERTLFCDLTSAEWFEQQY